MEMITPSTGDVILLEPDTSGNKRDPWPWLITRFTGSKFSHSIVVVNDGTFADANPGPAGIGDIHRWGEKDLEDILRSVTRLHLCRPTGQVADEWLLDQAVCRLEKAGYGQNPSVIFSDGAVFALALLRALQTLPRPLKNSKYVQQLRLATMVALENGPSRLFCSEFVYRVLTEAGQQPELPKDPVVPVDDLIEGVIESSPEVFLERILEWFMKWLSLDADSLKTIEETREGIITAFRKNERPKRIEVANYFTPEDFHRTDSLREIAVRTKDDNEWRPTAQPGR